MCIHEEHAARPETETSRISNDPEAAMRRRPWAHGLLLERMLTPLGVVQAKRLVVDMTLTYCCLPPQYYLAAAFLDPGIGVPHPTRPLRCSDIRVVEPIPFSSAHGLMWYHP